MRREKLYKVLVDGKSCHGGNMTWSLPKNGKPGKWHYLNSGTLVPCWWGFHLTRDWKKWLKVGCEIYEAEAAGKRIDCDDDKIVCSAARLLGPVRVPKWWRDVERFVGTIRDVPWMKRVKPPRKSWRVFPTMAAARAAVAYNAPGLHAAKNAAADARRDVAWCGAACHAVCNAAWQVAWNATQDWERARDAGLLSGMLVVPRGKLAAKHIRHARARWDVWQRGYGLYCDVNGVLYVYEKVA